MAQFFWVPADHDPHPTIKRRNPAGSTARAQSANEPYALERATTASAPRSSGRNRASFRSVPAEKSGCVDLSCSAARVAAAFRTSSMLAPRANARRCAAVCAKLPGSFCRSLFRCAFLRSHCRFRKFQNRDGERLPAAWIFKKRVPVAPPTQVPIHHPTQALSFLGML